MNKLLQHIIDAGDVSHKYLPYLQGGGALPDINYIPRASGDMTGPSVDTAMAANIKAAQQRQRQTQLRENQGEIKPVAPRRSMLSKALAVAAHPFTAASYTVKGQDLPDNFERGSVKGYDVIGSLVNPFSAIDAVRKTPESFQQGDYLGAALNVADIIPGVVTVPKAARSVLNQADRLSPIGRKLEAIKVEGKAAGLSDYDIAKRQFDQVGITSGQRQGYIPGASELARKYIIPYGYSDKFKQVASNIRRGGVDYTDPSVVSSARADAWNLYLGFPQRKRTFRMAETAPVNHSAYSGKQLTDMDLYSLNQEGLIAEELGRGAESISPAGIRAAIDNLKAKSFVDVDPVDVMGNFNARFTKEGLQYNDIWDLNPSYDLVNFLPKKLRDKVDENPLFYKKTQLPGTSTPFYTPRKMEVNVSRYFGKPFMSHGTVDLQAEDYRNKLLKNLQNRRYHYTRNEEAKSLYAPSIDKLNRQISEIESIDRFKQEGGEADVPREYKGSSVVDYLATKGYSGSKSFRKKLAETYGVEDYNFSARKNLELLRKLRENDDLLEGYTQNFAPVPVERIEQMLVESNSRPAVVSPEEQEAQRRRNYNNFRQRVALQLGYDPFLREPQVEKTKLPQFSLSNAYGKRNIFDMSVPVKQTVQQPVPVVQKQQVKQQAAPLEAPVEKMITGFRFDKAPLPVPNSYLTFPTPVMQDVPAPPVVKQMGQLPKKTSAKQAASSLNKQADAAPWYQRLWNEFSENIQSDQLDWGAVSFGSPFNAEGAKSMARDAAITAAGLISTDKRNLAESYFKRKDLKDNEDLQETRTKFTIPQGNRPAIVTGDTIPLNKDRYIIPAMIDLNQTKWGVRNRGDYRPLQTEAGDITTFQSFVPAAEYFAKNPKDKDNSTYVGVDQQGSVKVGNRKDFEGTDYQISKTVGNRIVDFPTEADGKMKLKPSSPKASSKHLSPVTKVIEDGKVVYGSMNLLIPKKSRNTNSFGEITGGRVIFKTPDGEQFLVSGSAEDIRKAFYSIKGNHPWLDAVTLDNGTYATGYRNKSGKISTEELKKYQGSNSTGSAFLYLKPGNYSRASNKLKYKDVPMTTPNIRTEKDESFKKGHALTNAQEAIVLHHTGFSDTTGLSKGMSTAMRGVHKHFQEPGASSHVVIDFDGTRYNYARPDQVTFHAGKSMLRGKDNVNDFGIGIEFQGDTNNKPLTDKQIDSFVEYIAPIIRNKKIPLESIVTHKQIRDEYMQKNKKDKDVLGKADVSTYDYKRIVAALKKRGIYQNGGPVVEQQNVYVDKSNIEGNGLFATDKIKKGSLIGLAHANGQPVGMIGHFHNHSKRPNAISIPFGNKRYLVAAQDLPAGKEITTDYRMQPELEQPAASWIMKNGGQHGGLDRWFAEKWVDIKTGKQCGRQQGEDRSYPACRPSRRVTSQTPKTSSEMSPAEKAKFKRTKTSSERIPYNHKRK